jgi:hypothetical protein
MARTNLVLSLFCEDSGHERFVRALVRRLAREEDIPADLRTFSAEGGLGRAVEEFRRFQRALRTGLVSGLPDLLVVVIDANSHGWAERRAEVESVVESSLFPAFVIGCPDPHIERWCFADPEAFFRVVGKAPPADPEKFERNFYKNLLRKTILEAGQPILTDAMEFAPDFVREMDLFKAGKAQTSLRHFVDALRSSLRAIRR